LSSTHHPALAALQSAKTSKEVKVLLDSYGHEICNAAWKELSELDKASLLLAKEFNGTIIHDIKEQ
tara:strand:- start:1729 stop:1926 length:198 start_codon:yes stop_codon:yes gene_type:complete